MNQHYHIPLDDLLVKYLLQEASPEERLTVDQWLAADPANRHYYDQLRLIWEKSDQPGIVAVAGEEEQAWQTLKEKLTHPAKRHTPIHTLRWAAAAAAVAAVLCGFFWWRPTPITWQQIVARDAIRIDSLPDGSIVTLNKHSSLSQPIKFDTKERTVTLAGEAFFRIAPDKDHPFHVKTNGITITVLGTSFNIRTQNNKTVVLVETGGIEVENRQSKIRVEAGETITLGQNDPTLQTQPAETPIYKYYQPRVFVCRDTPLGDLVDALNQAYGDSIAIENPALRYLKITTTFQDESLPQILDVIKKTLNITVQYSGARYTLK